MLTEVNIVILTGPSKVGTVFIIIFVFYCALLLSNYHCCVHFLYQSIYYWPAVLHVMPCFPLAQMALLLSLL